MNPNQPPLHLLHLLNLPQSTLPGDRLHRWVLAFDAWLAGRRTRLAPTIAHISYFAWREILALTRKPPWDITVPDIGAYIAALTKSKLRPATIKLRLTALSKFYKYCQSHRIAAQCPAGFNPVAAVRPPEDVKYEKATYLSPSEEAALLDAIRQDPSPLGKRDYALFLMLLRTGWKSGDVCWLRWASFSAEDEYAPGESGSAVCCLGEPLRKDGLRHLLRRHARRAGLKAEAITTHTLRHTFVMRQLQAGASPETVAAMLHLQEVRNVQNYVRRLAQNPKRRMRARKPAEKEIWPGLSQHLIGDRIGSVSPPLIGSVSRPSHPPNSAQGLSRGPCRAGYGNSLALKHGFYARFLPEFEWLAELGFRPKGLDGAVVRWRVVMQRAAILGNHGLR